MQNFSLSLVIFTSILLGESSNSRGIVDDFSKLKYKIAKATRVSTPPVIDGILDDSAWNKAIVLDQLVQHELVSHPKRAGGVRLRGDLPSAGNLC